MDVHLLPAAGCYLYSSGRGEERSETTLALALLLGGEEEEGLEEVNSYLLDGKGERVTSSRTYAESQTSQVRARHWNSSRETTFHGKKLFSSGLKIATVIKGRTGLLASVCNTN